jgi:hypothetical protein
MAERSIGGPSKLWQQTMDSDSTAKTKASLSNLTFPNTNELTTNTTTSKAVMIKYEEQTAVTNRVATLKIVPPKAALLDQIRKQDIQPKKAAVRTENVKREIHDHSTSRNPPNVMHPMGVSFLDQIRNQDVQLKRVDANFEKKDPKVQDGETPFATHQNTKPPVKQMAKVSPPANLLDQIRQQDLKLKKITPASNLSRKTPSNPVDDIMARIRAGDVKLKKVDKSTLETPKTFTSPMGEMLAKMQAKKAEYLRTEEERKKNLPYEEIDW